MRLRSRPVRTAFSSTAVCLCFAGCDLLLVDPAPAPGRDVEIDQDLASAVEPWGVRELWLRFTHGSESRDTVVAGRFRDGGPSHLCTVWRSPSASVGCSGADQRRAVRDRRPAAGKSKRISNGASTIERVPRIS